MVYKKKCHLEPKKKIENGSEIIGIEFKIKWIENLKKLNSLRIKEIGPIKKWN